MSGANGRGGRSSGRSGGRSEREQQAARPPDAGGSDPANPATSRAVRVTIPSDFVAGCQVQQQIISAIEKSGFNEDDIFGIKLALDEALINAIKHGNKLDPAKRVHIDASITPKRLEITIEDEGPGFNRAGVPDPTLEENLEKCSGRGILLMEAYMDRVEWSEGGKRVRMIKTAETK